MKSTVERARVVWGSVVRAPAGSPRNDGIGHADGLGNTVNVSGTGPVLTVVASGPDPECLLTDTLDRLVASNYTVSPPTVLSERWASRPRGVYTVDLERLIEERDGVRCNMYVRFPLSAGAAWVKACGSMLIFGGRRAVAEAFDAIDPFITYRS